MASNGNVKLCISKDLITHIRILLKHYRPMLRSQIREIIVIIVINLNQINEKKAAHSNISGNERNA